MGFSARPEKTDYGYRLADRVADLSSFIDQVLPEGELDLVVHDWGGMIGCAWAVQHAKRVRRLVCAAIGLAWLVMSLNVPATALVRPARH